MMNRLSAQSWLMVFGIALVLAASVVAFGSQSAFADSCSASPTYGSFKATKSLSGSGTYTIWVHMKTPSKTSNKLLLNVNGTCYAVGATTSIPANSWLWINYHNGSKSNVMQQTIGAGTLTVTLTGITPGVRFDEVEFVPGSCVPSGNGSNCVSQSSSTGGSSTNGGGSVAVGTTGGDQNSTSGGGTSTTGGSNGSVPGASSGAASSSPLKKFWYLLIIVPLAIIAAIVLIRRRGQLQQQPVGGVMPDGSMGGMYDPTAYGASPYAAGGQSPAFQAPVQPMDGQQPMNGADGYSPNPLSYGNPPVPQQPLMPGAQWPQDPSAFPPQQMPPAGQVGVPGNPGSDSNQPPQFQ